MQAELIKTPRLRGEKISKSHWQLWLNMGFNSTVMATLGGVWNQEKAHEKLQWNCKQWRDYEHGQWMFFDQKLGRFVGREGTIIPAKQSHVLYRYRNPNSRSA